ncbi:large conductance mechanosensitive channel protein [Xylanimonas cellulosilytica DSM 15894]|uniref:Large-conductance mechanosensitive channel n=1 Tax=Xylanimonas cellulosilytica (strain DSM 15894 / JCM 12276 / CECT 5975 / KCTC 9989 / LMG 20990 / NBRC 107835 / XIL07) TaxID=446471 RepID=D1BYF9_XYLCX|nr:large conductance mechanosensitive channel protein MscL [Xylanimonas cellulosilytica]ACZ31831.1 large conductance mechanosensitive channel protein [Xylanimonas cellulosilytica DSM 15894]
MLKGFKDFLLRGNVLDLAVGIVVGTAFTAVVTGLMDGVLNPLIALIFGQPDISEVGFRIGDTAFPLGLFLQAVLNFLLVATALYFVVVVPVKHFSERVKRGEEAPPEPPTPDVALLQEIRDLLAARTPNP